MNQADLERELVAMQVDAYERGKQDALKAFASALCTLQCSGIPLTVDAILETVMVLGSAQGEKGGS